MKEQNQGNEDKDMMKMTTTQNSFPERRTYVTPKTNIFVVDALALFAGTQSNIGGVTGEGEDVEEDDGQNDDFVKRYWF